MERFKKILLKLLFPHTAIVVLLVPIATALLIYAFVYPEANPIWVYGSYFLSAYALTVVCTKAPSIYKKVKEIKDKNKYINRYVADAEWRVKLSLLGSVSLNILYALMQLATGVFYREMWFYALAAYYVLLIIMRVFLLRDTTKTVPGRNKLSEFYRYRFCGFLLLIMTQALAVIVFYIVRRNRGFEYHSIHTIAMAAYTFASITMAIVNVVKYRKFESPLMSAAKAISLASATVSMLSLETAMLAAFGEQENPEFRNIMTALTGTAVCAFVLGMSVYMIVRANRQIKLIKKRRRENGK